MAGSSGNADHGDTARLESLFERALELPPEQCGPFLDRECADNPALRARVARLLDMDASGDRRLDKPADLPASLLEAAARDPSSSGLFAAVGEGLRPGQRVGAYEIIRPLGAGGMGAVYEARQARPERTVALKVMNPALAAPGSLRRFEYEAEILARLQHPGIAQVFEAGVADVGPFRIPFFAMELVPNATTLTASAARSGLDLRGRLELFLQACAAVHSGHLLGVIHRDLKPGNILVAEDRPATGADRSAASSRSVRSTSGDAPRVKVIDFGIARLADGRDGEGGSHTRTGDMVGTPAYMSPEQARADGTIIDARADVYALCVVLFELLTDQRLYAEPAPGMAWRDRILREEPRRPSSVNPALNDELDAIILKGLRKEPEERYQSVDHLAGDVRRYLAGEPIEAKRGSTAYMLRKTLRRYRVPMAVLGLIVVTLGVALGVSLSLWSQTKEALALAEQRKTQAQEAEQRQAAEARKANEAFEFVRDIVTQEELTAELRHDPACLRSVLDEGARRFEANPDLDIDVQGRIALYLAQGYQLLEDWEASRLWGTKLLQIRSQIAPANDAAGFTFMLAQESFAAQLGDFSAAATVFRKRCREAEELFGPDALPTLFARLNLGASLLLLADHDGSEEAMGDLIAVSDAALGRLHFLSIGAHLTLVELRVAQGRAEEAVALATEGLARIEEAEPGNASSRLAHLSSLAGAQLMAGRPEAAEPIFRDIWEKSAASLGEDASPTLDRAFGLSGALLELGRLEEAETLLNSIYAARLRTVGESHPVTGETRARLGELLNRQGRHNESAEHLEAALALFRVQLPESSPMIVRTTISLAAAESGRGNASRAAELLAAARSAVTGSNSTAVMLRGLIDNAVESLPSSTETNAAP